ncbi:tetratricopeptide repeat protein [Mucilaginibacter boryungensis]|uniref:Tetratricopeptide repeat protein n=1 Tax=Mucilaginibacter boryungensis TaxID=768480 RepID=A0ABR9XKM6_9SPHI|nr:tetratricopeptide repeat protein [Mucilaginibacter boryungensis]MBE9667528.1 tetratricopeptide repeat protein [Mucilaginibacter boryungensis]
MFFHGNFPYYFTVALQVLCVIHCLRRGKQNWIWLIIFLPLVGCVVYLIMEIIPSSRVRAPRVDVGAIINPGGKIKKLEENLRFTDTFNNRIILADAYLETGQTDKAIELYENSLTGAFSENEHVLTQLIIAYYKQERYADAIKMAGKIYHNPQFLRSQAHLFYAMSLESVGEQDKAEAEFKAMQGRYSYYEQRYQYGMFLLRNNRDEDAGKVFATMLEEEPHLSSMERKSARAWCAKAKAELKAIA